MDIEKELSQNQTILLIMSSEKYNSLIVDIVKQLPGKSICYITLNKTYDSLRELFKKKGIKVDNIFFIDAISKTIKKTSDQTDSCYFVDSPSALTEISLVISKFLKHNFEYLIFDSLTNLMVYSKKAPVAVFVSSIVNKIKETKTNAAFYALKMEQHQELIQETSIFVDKVVDLSKITK